jgi:hypothetical protein
MTEQKGSATGAASSSEPPVVFTVAVLQSKGFAYLKVG